MVMGAAALISFVVYVAFRSVLFAVCLPSALGSGWVLASEFLLPYSGGGASFWPIALLMVVVLTLMGALFGLLPAHFIVDRVIGEK